MSEKDIKVEKFEKEASTLVSQSTELMVLQENKRFILKNEEEREMAGILLKEAHELEKKIKAHYKPIEDAHKETGKRIKAAKDEQLAGPTKAKQILAQGIGEYEAKMRREAEEKARKERERIEAARLARAEEMQKKAEKLKETGTPEGMVAALNLESDIEDILDAPEPVVEVKKPDKISGIKQRRYVKCEITGEIALKRFIINQIQKGKLWEGLLAVNEPSVRAYIKSCEASGNTINELQNMFPGLRVWEEFKATT